MSLESMHTKKGLFNRYFFFCRRETNIIITALIGNFASDYSITFSFNYLTKHYRPVINSGSPLTIELTSRNFLVANSLIPVG